MTSLAAHSTITMPPTYPDCAIDIDVKSIPSKDNSGITITKITLTFSHKQYADIYHAFLEVTIPKTPLVITTESPTDLVLTLTAPNAITASSGCELEYPIKVNNTYLEFSSSEAADKWQGSTGLWCKRSGGNSTTGTEEGHDAAKRLWFQI